VISRIIILWFLTSCSIFSYAQLSIGASTGLNYGSVFIPEKTDKDIIENKQMTISTNFNIGVRVDYEFKDIALSSGFYFSRRGTNLKSLSRYSDPFLNHNSLSFYFWEAPILMRIPIYKNKIEVGCGIINSFIIDADINIGINFYNPYQLDLKAIARYNFTPKLSTEIGYLYGGLNHIFNKDDLFYFGHSVFNLNVNYRFLSFDKKK